MTLVLDAAREGPPWPLATILTLTCDGAHPPPRMDRMTQVFLVGSLPERLSAASRAGWKETYRDGRKLWLGPCCSGKVPR